MAERKPEAWQWNELIFATGNPHKVDELNAMVQPALGLRVVGLSAFSGLPAIAEDQPTFAGNAIKKAETIAHHLGRPVAADDSGLVVDALQGAPGVHSARYAGADATDEENNRKLLSELNGVPPNERGATFVCVLALAVPGETTWVVRGECRGRIAEEPRGAYGFGYDPLFWLPDRRRAMAELPPEEKNQISHRAQAVRKWITTMRERYRFYRKE
jgi:XTP/dITP diphosphohydrolase